MVEHVEELRPELNVLFFTNRRVLGKGEIRVGLSRAANDADAGVAEIRSIADRWGSAKCRGIEEVQRIWTEDLRNHTENLQA